MTANKNLAQLTATLQQIFNGSKPPTPEQTTQLTDLLRKVVEEVTATGGNEKDPVFDGPDMSEFFMALPRGIQYSLLTSGLQSITEITEVLVEVATIKTQTIPDKIKLLLKLMEKTLPK